MTPKQDSIIEKYLNKGAYQYHYTSQKWEDYIKMALEKDSTIALLWQRRALPYWKTRKYEIALKYYDEAVKYDREEYLGRRGFLKCIFLKNYTEALKDLDMTIKEYGNGIQNDHSYNFYKSLCYLQLDQYDQALYFMQKEVDDTKKRAGEEWVPAICYFYLGVIYYEKRDYQKSIELLDRAIKLYPTFSDAKYYKAICNYKINEDAAAYYKILREAKKNFDDGYTINEGDSPYELYPYQVNWYMVDIKKDDNGGS